MKPGAPKPHRGIRINIHIYNTNFKYSVNKIITKWEANLEY